NEREWGRVELQMAKEGARANETVVLQHSFSLQLRKSQQRRRRALSKVSKDQTQIFFGRVPAYADLSGKTYVLCGLFDALPRTIIFPAMIEAADAIAFHPAHRELGSAVRAAMRQ